MHLVTRARVLLGACVVFALAGCATNPPSAVSGWTGGPVKSYYSGEIGYCWAEVSPGGPRTNICGGSGHGGGRT